MNDSNNDAEPNSGSDFDLSGMPETTRDLQPTVDWLTRPDTQLQRMSQYADQSGIGIGITLVMAGGVISGTVVSANEFYTSMSAQFTEAVDKRGDEAQSETAAHFAELFFDEPAKASVEQVQKFNKDYDEGKLIEPPYLMNRYIHLKDARHSVPGQGHLPLNFTRVLLSQVSAWAIGDRWVDND